MAARTTCLECGGPLHASAQRPRFCTTKCRQVFNHRKQARGAVLYDLFMAIRFERSLAKNLKLWGVICGLASQWREEDKDTRAGRKSWLHPKAALEVLNSK